MARLPRLTLPNQLHHVIQRGNNSQPIVFDNDDRQVLLGLLAEKAAPCNVALHAYVILDNQFQVLATPSSADGVPLWMQAVGRRYVRYVNDRHGRTGTLWEGRYKSSLIQADRYLLACMAYIDRSPVRAGVAVEAADYPWSSYAHYAGLRNDKILTPHPLYWHLGNTPFAREAAYAEMVRAGLAVEDEAVLMDATLHGWAAGDAEFLASLQKITERRIVKSRPGRPAGTDRVSSS